MTNENNEEKTVTEERAEDTIEPDQIDVAEMEEEPVAAPPETEPEVDELTALREQLEDAQTRSTEYLDGWQRARAEFANYRRREEQRRKQMDEETKSKLLVRLLPVVDDLERAFQAVPEEMRDSSWVEGLSLVGQKLQAILEKDGVSAMSVQAGDVFDPNHHEAVTHEPSEQYVAGQIVDVLQRGYKLNDAVLRPALVRVSSGKLNGDE